MMKNLEIGELKLKVKNLLEKLFKSPFLSFRNHLDHAINHPNVILPQAVLAFDMLMAFLSLFIALYLRVGEEFLDYSPQFILKNMVVFALTSASIFCWMQTHRALWRYIALEDIIPLSLAAILSNIIYFPLMILIAQQESMPRTVVIINCLVLIMLLSVPRFLFRFVYERHLSQDKRINEGTSIPVVLIGSGLQAESFIREALHSSSFPYNPIAVVTFDDEGIGRKIHGVPISGSLQELVFVLNDLQSANCLPKQLVIIDNHLENDSRRLIAQTAKLYDLTLMQLLHHFFVDVIEKE
jgi:FlaA1/EpsC-like NDP-sugar epimerase